MSEPSTTIIKRGTRPESAALAGIVYAVLAVAAVVITNRLPDPSSTNATWQAWIEDRGNRRLLGLALTLASVSSVAFFWFVAVVRRRVGDREDRFFSTVFIGSATVHVALWLVAVSIVAAPAFVEGDAEIGIDSIRLANGTAQGLLLVAGPRIQAVFVASTSTIFLRTQVVPNWLAGIGYALAVAMFVLPIVASPMQVGVPVFVFVSSVVILVVRQQAGAGPS